MLRITTTITGETTTLKLEGKLSGPWVEEFQRCWKMSSDIYIREGLVVDLSGVTFVDSAGKELLCSILAQGGKLVGSGLVPKSLIEEIASEKSGVKPGKTGDKLKQHAGKLRCTNPRKSISSQMAGVNAMTRTTTMNSPGECAVARLR